MLNWLPPPYDPVVVDQATFVYPANVVPLMPDPQATPEANRIWFALVRRWFSEGLPEDVQFYLRPGIDGETAYRHLCCVLGSYQHPHGEKERAAAFLMSCWFEKVVIDGEVFEEADRE